MTIKDIYKLYTAHYLVDTDTRSIRKNTLFFALKGERFNGNTFAKKALEQGASYAIIDEEEYLTDNRMILVDDVLQCLQKLSTYHRLKLDIPIIGLTGSNGKTTTKELIYSVLSKSYTTAATKGNLNNHIGVPLTLLSMTPDTEIGIVEMGANHLREIAFLASIAQPNFGYITNFGKAHLEGFGGVEGVITGKSELYDFLRATNGIAFVNPNDKLQLEKTKGLQTIPLLDSVVFEDASPMVQLNYSGNKICSHLIGSYNFANIQVAITIGAHFKVDDKTIIKAIENYIPTNNRSQVIKQNGHTIILDAYNANPSSMEVAIKSFDKLDGNSKLLVLGDMFELGINSAKEHQHVAELAESIVSNQVFLIGEAFSKTRTKKALKFERFQDFISYFDVSNYKNSTFFIKGSRGMALERILNEI